MIFQIGYIELGVGIFALALVQGVAYAIATHFTNKHLIKHLEKIENKLKKTNESGVK